MREKNTEREEQKDREREKGREREGRLMTALRPTLPPSAEPDGLATSDERLDRRERFLPFGSRWTVGRLVLDDVANVDVLLSSSNAAYRSPLGPRFSVRCALAPGFRRPAVRSMFWAVCSFALQKLSLSERVQQRFAKRRWRPSPEAVGSVGKGGRKKLPR